MLDVTDRKFNAEVKVYIVKVLYLVHVGVMCGREVYSTVLECLRGRSILVNLNEVG
jgi:predicted nucleic-acid-binding protein